MTRQWFNCISESYKTDELSDTQCEFTQKTNFEYLFKLMNGTSEDRVNV